MTQLHLYNSLTRRKEVFIPIDPNHVKMYVCGPTVYDTAHLGNARPVVVFDVLYRVLEHLYPQVTYARNITDVDDKIIKASQETGEPIDQLTRRTTNMYHKDMAALKALSPTMEPRATDHIVHMQLMIETLIRKGHAYVNEGHVLFDVPSDSNYGTLSHVQREDMLAGARVEVAPYKKSPEDFVLWKPSDPDMPGWDSPWGFGRPGWHIECSAMGKHHLGETFDIHGGGIDLIFPHHENEIAQSTCAHNGKPLAHYWMHNGHLMVHGEKMSKSLGNFFTVHEKLKDMPGEVIRLVLLSTHYRQPLDWTEHSVEQATNILDRWYGALRDMPTVEDLPDCEPHVMAALQDDLNIPLAIAQLHEIVAEIYQTSDLTTKNDLQALLKASANMLGFLEDNADTWFQQVKAPQSAGSALSAAQIETLIQQRNDARALKDFKTSDAIRLRLEQHGVILEDGPQGTTWRYK